MIKYCIFDLDGTLLNTLNSIKYYLNNTLRDNGIGEITLEECRQFIGDGAKMLCMRALNSRGVYDGEILSRVLSQYNDAYHKNPYYLTAPYPDITDTLDKLSSRGITLAVLSNKPDRTAKAVCEKFFAGRFHFVMGGIDGVPLKPAPDSCISLMQKMGANPSEVAFIGDTGVDIETGVRAGCGKKIGVSWGFRDREELVAMGADTVLDTAHDLLNFIGEE